LILTAATLAGKRAWICSFVVATLDRESGVGGQLKHIGPIKKGTSHRRII